MQHTSTTDAQVCVKNYNSDSNNKDIITVDYLITGGRQEGLFDHLPEKQMCCTKQYLYYHVPKLKNNGNGLNGIQFIRVYTASEKCVRVLTLAS